jgi:hypothetical protein
VPLPKKELFHRLQQDFLGLRIDETHAVMIDKNPLLFDTARARCDTLAKIRCPRAPGKGGFAKPGNSRPYLLHITIRSPSGGPKRILGLLLLVGA